MIIYAVLTDQSIGRLFMAGDRAAFPAPLPIGGVGMPIAVILIYMLPGTLLDGIAMALPGAMPGA